MQNLNDRHAVFVNSEDGVTFRVGQPVDWNRATDRWLRLDDRRIAKGLTVRHDGRKYRAKSIEVRATDRHGRGLGSERHATALTAPYRMARTGR